MICTMCQRSCLLCVENDKYGNTLFYTERKIFTVINIIKQHRKIEYTGLVITRNVYNFISVCLPKKLSERKNKT